MTTVSLHPMDSMVATQKKLLAVIVPEVQELA
jgi:hypothetical protein